VSYSARARRTPGKSQTRGTGKMRTCGLANLQTDQRVNCGPGPQFTRWLVCRSTSQAER